jgi:hypothetical protein
MSHSDMSGDIGFKRYLALYSLRYEQNIENQHLFEESRDRMSFFLGNVPVQNSCYSVVSFLRGISFRLLVNCTLPSGRPVILKKRTVTILEVIYKSYPAKLAGRSGNFLDDHWIMDLVRFGGKLFLIFRHRSLSRVARYPKSPRSTFWRRGVRR